jgi:hypothetical protein
MEIQLVTLLEDLKAKQQSATNIHERELEPNGNIRIREASWGKIVAYSHCIKQLEKILKIK